MDNSLVCYECQIYSSKSFGFAIKTILKIPHNLCDFDFIVILTSIDKIKALLN